MTNILLDSDVMLDFFLKREPFYNSSGQILSICETHKVRGFITGLALANTYYMLRKRIDHEGIIHHFEKLMTFLDILPIDKLTLEAMRSQFRDFEDALQNFSAERSPEIRTIITRNVNDYKSSNLNILTPNMFLATL